MSKSNPSIVKNRESPSANKDCLPNPWETAIHDHEVDDIVDDQGR